MVRVGGWNMAKCVCAGQWRVAGWHAAGCMWCGACCGVSAVGWSSIDVCHFQNESSRILPQQHEIKVESWGDLFL